MQEGLAQRLEDRPRIAPQTGAKVLGPQERARVLEKVDAAIDLVHVAVLAQHIKRKLHVDIHAKDRRSSYRLKRPGLTFRQ